MRIPLALLVLVPVVGCGNITINFDKPPRTLARDVPIPGGAALLEADDMGNLLLAGDPLQVEPHSEHARFGVTCVDAGALPRAWRPQHLAQFEGPMVTSLYTASPMAFAGLSPFDGVESIDGVALDGPEKLVDLLGAARPGETVTLQVLSPDGRREITADASDGVSDSSNFYLPFVYLYRKSAVESRVEIGPLGLSEYQSKITDTGPGDGPWSGHLRSVSWSTVLNLLSYKGTSTLDGESLYSQWRILWLIKIGTDADDGSDS